MNSKSAKRCREKLRSLRQETVMMIDCSEQALYREQQRTLYLRKQVARLKRRIAFLENLT